MRGWAPTAHGQRLEADQLRTPGSESQSTSLVTSTLAGQIASRQVLRYAGYAFDAESGLYYCSARFYDPATRQWTTGDPAKADGEESPYQYCGGEPVGEVDPTGLANHRSSVTVWNSSGTRRMLGWFYYYDRGPTGGDSAAYVVAIDFVAAVKEPATTYSLSE